jgi:methylated-DNA-[protein]-cysteine S-methyltransferase
MIKQQYWCQMSPFPVLDRVSTAPHTAGFSTRLGWMALAWRDQLVCGLAFGHRSRREAQRALGRLLQLPGQSCHTAGKSESTDVPRPVERLINALCRFADGELVEFDRVVVDDAHLTPFARRVTSACRRIAWGEVRTYGQLAAVCGSPGAARAVGQVMAANRYPLIVPCHRVLAAGGRLGGYSAPQGLNMKRRLLAMEQ